MRYLLDTVTLIRHFSGQGKLGNAATRIFDQAETSGAEFYISAATLMEIIYLAEKKRIPINLEEIFNEIEGNALYTIVDLTPEILRVAAGMTCCELHDRLILATAKWLEIPVISANSKLSDMAGVTAIWDDNPRLKCRMHRTPRTSIITS